MNVFDALLSVADHIEQRPQLYNFEKTEMPTANSPRACILGRLGEVMGLDVDNADLVAPRVLRCAPAQFFDELAAIIYRQTDRPRQAMTPLLVAALIPAAVREWVSIHRGEERPAIPAEVRAIFDAPATALEVGSVSQWAYVSPQWSGAPPGYVYNLNTDSHVLAKPKGEMYAAV